MPHSRVASVKVCNRESRKSDGNLNILAHFYALFRIDSSGVVERERLGDCVPHFFNLGKGYIINVPDTVVQL